jgi:hypothetical protein
MKPSVLFVAFHYPPIQMSSGVHRTVAFSRHLAENGWDVSVLTVDTATYDNVNKIADKLIPQGVQVLRARCFDAARDLSIKGRYLSWLAQPDRWQSWIPFAVWRGWRHCRQHNCQVIVSTYPIATAHIIGYLLHKVTGKPWIADLRDPMLQIDYPSDPIRRRIFRWIEQKIITHAKFAILTSPGAVDLYRNSYPEKPKEFWHLISNGFDEEIFRGLETSSIPKTNTRYILLHSGTVYPHERDPKHLFQALQRLKTEQPSLASRLIIRLRATGHDALFQSMLSHYQIQDIVELVPALDYRAAAQEMFNVDALLLLQASNCNYQTPAKAYEYIRAKRPILVLAPKTSDTFQLIVQSNVAIQAELDDTQAIYEALQLLVHRLDQQSFVYLSDAEVQRFSRATGAEQLHNDLSELVE